MTKELNGYAKLPNESKPKRDMSWLEPVIIALAYIELTQNPRRGGAKSRPKPPPKPLPVHKIFFGRIMQKVHFWRQIIRLPFILLAKLLKRK
ncbi:MAG: hypothetical protein OXU76_05670 [Alphaproteobacteria bacterium]|nr:hypothetical protein [Alphaproteobacteria bacterium]